MGHPAPGTGRVYSLAESDSWVADSTWADQNLGGRMRPPLRELLGFEE